MKGKIMKKTGKKAGGPVRIEDGLEELRYSIRGVVRFSICRDHLPDGRDVWFVTQKYGFGACTGVQMMDGTKRGGAFMPFKNAEQELREIFESYQAPLTRREIVHHFTMAWMKREEQAKELIAFREALLAQDMKKALKIYGTLTSYTQEAIPDKVLLHLIIERERRKA